MAWVWVGSQLQPKSAEGVGGLAALVIIVGPIASYVAVLILAGRFAGPRGETARPARFAWNRSVEDSSHARRPTPVIEQIFILATVLVAVGFEVYFLFLAHQR